MLNFNAVCPIAWKKGAIWCHLNIAKILCSNDELFNLEVDKLRQMFYQTGYPSPFFNCFNRVFLHTIWYHYFILLIIDILATSYHIHYKVTSIII